MCGRDWSSDVCSSDLLSYLSYRWLPSLNWRSAGIADSSVLDSFHIVAFDLIWMIWRVATNYLVLQAADGVYKSTKDSTEWARGLLL